MQNRSHAVMAQRNEAVDSRDDFPTPPWATRALLEHALGSYDRADVALEPACGQGHMSKVLEEYFAEVRASDIWDYGYGEVADFLTTPHEAKSVDWVITNPPFRLAEDFILKGLSVARKGVAMLTRTVFIESIGRFERVFTPHPPVRFAQFTERVPMVKGRLDKKASTATGYAWIIWRHDLERSTELFWIPPSRKALEKETDYSDPPPKLAKAVGLGQGDLFERSGTNKASAGRDSRQNW